MSASALDSLAPTAAPNDLSLERRAAASTRAVGGTVIAWFIGLLLSACFAYAVSCYWAPAHPGVDQNGYLVGGKNFSHTWTMALVPVRPGSTDFDPHQFVGRMWVGADVGTPAERFYPKYPLGYPALVALVLLLGGPSMGATWVYLINPVAMTLAVLGTFVLARRLCGTFAAVLAALVFATSPATLQLATNPNSHATAVCLVVWGMIALLQWWNHRSLWRGLLAGFLLGYAVTIRYTEATLLLPIVTVTLMNFQTGSRRSWIDSLSVLLGWSLPVICLLAYNKSAMGTWTGYDPTNESLGFSWEYAADNWETMLRQLATTGLFFVFPLSIAGMVWMFFRNWRLACVYSGWIIPCLLVYTFYYWAPDGTTIGYIRFFVTIFPALAACAFWLLTDLGKSVSSADSSRKAAGLSVAAGVVAAISIAVHVENTAATLEADSFGRTLLTVNTSNICRAVPAGSTVFCGEQNLLHHLQFVGDYTLYSGETLNRNFIAGLPGMGSADEPQGLDPTRRMALYERLKGLNQQQFDEAARQIVLGSLDSGRRVFIVLPNRNAQNQNLRSLLGRDNRQRNFPEVLRRMLNTSEFDTRVTTAWTDPGIKPAEPTMPANRPRGRRPDPLANRMDRRFQAMQGTFEVIEIVRKPPG